VKLGIMNRSMASTTALAEPSGLLAVPMRLIRSFGPKLCAFLADAYANKITFAGLMIIVVWTGLAISAPVLAPYDPLYVDVDSRLSPPSRDHLFGTDELGRDVLSRVLHGSRISLPMCVLTISMALLIGGGLGVFAGFIGGWFDELVMRVGDVVLAFPTVILAMAIVAALGSGLINVLIAIVAVWWPRYARVMRGQVLMVRENLYIMAARSVGLPSSRIILRHVLPNCFAPALVQFTMDLGTGLVLLAGLSFIGLGALPPNPEWGAMIRMGHTYFSSWWIATAAGLAITSVVLGFTLLGDGLRDILDPRLR